MALPKTYQDETSAEPHVETEFDRVGYLVDSTAALAKRLADVASRLVGPRPPQPVSASSQKLADRGSLLDTLEANVVQLNGYLASMSDDIERMNARL